MRRIAATLVSLAVLSGTAFLLMADSAEHCTHPAQTVRFDVSGTCGPAGQVSATIAKDQCSFTLEGGNALGLPEVGDIHDTQDLRRVQFTVGGPVTVAPDAGGDCERDAGINGDAGSDGCNHGIPLADGGMEITRYCSPDPDGGTVLTCTDYTTCTATLTPLP